jgi:hypothetical protein
MLMLAMNSDHPCRASETGNFERALKVRTHTRWKVASGAYDAVRRESGEMLVQHLVDEAGPLGGILALIPTHVRAHPGSWSRRLDLLARLKVSINRQN